MNMYFKICVICFIPFTCGLLMPNAILSNYLLYILFVFFSGIILGILIQWWF